MMHGVAARLPSAHRCCVVGPYRPSRVFLVTRLTYEWIIQSWEIAAKTTSLSDLEVSRLVVTTPDSIASSQGLASKCHQRVPAPSDPSEPAVTVGDTCCRDFVQT